MRKTKLLLLIIGFTLSVYSFAQEESAKKNKGTSNFGIAHSFNSTNFAGNFQDNNYLNKTESYTSSNRTSLSFGFMAEYYVLEKLSIEVNALLTSCGSFLQTTTTVYNEVGIFEGDANERYVLRYLKIPLIVNFYPSENFYITAGGYGSTLIESKKYDSYWFDNPEPVNNINNIDYGIVAGFGLNTRIMRVGLQYTRGFANIINDNPVPEFYNQMFEIVLRWKIYSEARKK